MKKSASKVYEFDPLIYPRLIWIIYGNNFEELDKELCYTSGKALDFDSEKSDGCVAKVINKKTKKLGVVIWISDTSSINERLDIAAHEATHAALDILQDVGVYLDYENQEPLSYLIQYIFKCITTIIKT